MTEIKDLLLKILEESPDIAIWVLVIIYGYKVAVAGTIYGVVRFSIQKICETVTGIKKEPKEWKFGQDILIGSGASDALGRLLKEVMGDSKFSDYIHASDVRKLTDAYRESKAKKEGV